MSVFAHHLHAANQWLREVVFVAVALVLAVAVGFVVVGHVDPAASAVLLGGLIAGVAILLAHHVWYVRHRFAAEHDHARLRHRERRGF